MFHSHIKICKYLQKKINLYKTTKWLFKILDFIVSLLEKKIFKMVLLLFLMSHLFIGVA